MFCVQALLRVIHVQLMECLLAVYIVHEKIIIYDYFGTQSNNTSIARFHKDLPKYQGDLNFEFVLRILCRQFVSLFLVNYTSIAHLEDPADRYPRECMENVQNLRRRQLYIGPCHFPPGLWLLASSVFLPCDSTILP